MLTIDEIKTAVTRLGQKYGIKSAYLFGSYAKGKANEDSDIDIIIEKGQLKTYDEYCDMKFGLEDELGTNVDLLTTDGVKQRFLDLIRDDRILLYGA